METKHHGMKTMRLEV